MAFWHRKAAPKELPAHVDAFAMKRAFEQQRVGVNGLLGFPSADRVRLFRWSRESDVAYSCIRVIVESSQDPDLIVQRRQDRKSEWETEYGHPLRQLLMRPNPEMTQAEFLGVWLASEQICGIFCAEIERNRRGKPIALHPLDPTSMQRLDDGRWLWRSGGQEVIFEESDLFVSFLPDPQCPWRPLAPLQVALGPIEADWMQNAFVRAFFKNGGVPSGLIKVKGVLAGEDGKKRAEAIKQNWIRNRGILGRFFGAPEVFDDNATYEKVGSNLDELEGGTLRGQNEARICGVFGVPPLLVSAYVGLENVNQRASAIESQRDFWANKMSPVFKRMRTKLQWTLLLEWETEPAIRSESVRVFWDMSNVVALQETMAEKHLRAREDFRAGAVTLDEFREAIGKPPLPNGQGQYYLRRVNAIPVTAEVIKTQVEAAAAAAARAVSLVLTGASDPGLTAEQEDGKAVTSEAEL